MSAQLYEPSPRIVLAVDARTEDFTIAPTTRVAAPGQALSWTSDDGPFVLHFNHRTPVGSVVLHSKWTGSAHAAEAQVDDNARPGVYEYAIAIAKEDRVFIHVSGEVRVERPRRG
ncbi:MAG: hypothetical protein KIT09_22675 [Bryobacteraceae bacterium]|nr:hypothetical protein [Bryobacteraceae bacterium]